MSPREFLDNIDFSKDWLLEKIIEADFKEKETGNVEVVTIKKIDLYNLVLKFLKINERGE